MTDERKGEREGVEIKVRFTIYATLSVALNDCPSRDIPCANACT